MMTWMVLSLMISLALILSTNPISMLVLILAQTMNLCLIIWNYITTSWLSYILFLIFVGGLMVLFMYITSLASNEKFEMNLKMIGQASNTIWCMMAAFLALTFFYKSQTIENSTIIQQTSMMFTSSVSLLTILIMTYLLLTLIVAVKITSKFEGPMRSITKK